MLSQEGCKCKAIQGYVIRTQIIKQNNRGGTGEGVAGGKAIGGQGEE